MIEKKDKSFKNDFKIISFEKESKDFKEEYRDYYTPDLIFTNDKEIIICESSSASDRKVHLGEVLQFIAFANESKDEREFKLLILLCGKSASPPTKELQFDRIKHYVDFLYNQNNETFKNINYIGVGKFDEVELESELNNIISKCKSIFEKLK